MWVGGFSRPLIKLLSTCVWTFTIWDKDHIMTFIWTSHLNITSWPSSSCFVLIFKPVILDVAMFLRSCPKTSCHQSFPPRLQHFSKHHHHPHHHPLLTRPQSRSLTSLSRLVPAAVVGRSSGLYGLKRLLNTSEIPRADRPTPVGLGRPHPWKTCS